MTLLSIVGNADLFVKRCTQHPCEINKEEVAAVRKEKLEDVDKNLFYSIRPDSADVIKLDYIPEECISSSNLGSN